MITAKTFVKSSTGLHARPGTKLVELAMTFKSDIFIIKDDKKINAKEIFEVLSGGINFGDEIEIETNGEDEELALSEIIKYIETTEE